MNEERERSAWTDGLSFKTLLISHFLCSSGLAKVKTLFCIRLMFSVAQASKQSAHTHTHTHTHTLMCTVYSLVAMSSHALVI